MPLFFLLVLFLSVNDTVVALEEHPFWGRANLLRGPMQQVRWDNPLDAHVGGQVFWGNNQFAQVLYGFPVRPYGVPRNFRWPPAFPPANFQPNQFAIFPPA